MLFFWKSLIGLFLFDLFLLSSCVCFLGFVCWFVRVWVVRFEDVMHSKHLPSFEKDATCSIWLDCRRAVLH